MSTGKAADTGPTGSSRNRERPFRGLKAIPLAELRDKRSKQSLTAEDSLPAGALRPDGFMKTFQRILRISSQSQAARNPGVSGQGTLPPQWMASTPPNAFVRRATRIRPFFAYPGACNANRQPLPGAPFRRTNVPGEISGVTGGRDFKKTGLNIKKTIKFLISEGISCYIY